MPNSPLPPALLASLHAADLAALLALWAAWAALGWLSEHPPRGRPSITALMAGVRRDWMREFVRRENRIFDAQIIASLRQGSAFFASTAILAIGGVLALIGNVEPLVDLAAQIGQGGAPALLWQLRLLPAALLLTAAFLRFAWSNRVFGHASVMMAAVPEDASNPLAPLRAERAADLLNRAALNFSRGLRAMYFALASLAWIAGPVALVLATLALALTLARREFASVPRDVLAGDGPAR
jgi:uncharacterized membrane protein